MMGKFRATVSWTRTPGPQGFLVHRESTHEGARFLSPRPTAAFIKPLIFAQPTGEKWRVPAASLPMFLMRNEACWLLCSFSWFRSFRHLSPGAGGLSSVQRWGLQAGVPACAFRGLCRAWPRPPGPRPPRHALASPPRPRPPPQSLATPTPSAAWRFTEKHLPTAASNWFFWKSSL